MPKIRTSRTKKAPEGFEDIEPILDDYGRKMRDAENESHEGKRKSESLWPIMRISHARSRHIYELYYKREAISKELYDWLLKENLIAKWKKTGYEKLCCLRCIQTKASANDPDMNYQGSTCVCRVPKAQVRAGTVVECVHCGCRGCSSDS
ncbi:maternal g10 transcript [Multifurca ochricompacta]|uniref:Maternal g10 transcript n=1 Tax=Multifurca ochricompacta TaxID=376703 RepID=A0AAD4MBG5_9AGAM|nr:maternal g10 transcript [Multifurca ochricompacta]